MRVIFVTLCGLVLYVGFLVTTFFSNTNAGSSTGEVDAIKITSKTDYLNVPYGKYSEQNRPPVYIGIGPGGPPNQIIPLKTGLTRREDRL